MQVVQRGSSQYLFLCPGDPSVERMVSIMLHNTIFCENLRHQLNKCAVVFYMPLSGRLHRSQRWAGRHSVPKYPRSTAVCSWRRATAGADPYGAVHLLLFINIKAYWPALFKNIQALLSANFFSTISKLFNIIFIFEKHSVPRWTSVFLGGPASPAAWRGALGSNYSIGPGPAVVLPSFLLMTRAWNSE